MSRTQEMEDTNADKYRHITVGVADFVATVTFCRPPVNALDRRSLVELAEVFLSLGNSRDVRVAIFRTCGDRAFIAGADLKARDHPEPVEQEPAPWLTDPGVLGRRALQAVYECAVPVIAAVDGPAIGGGLAFASVCDILVASHEATFATTEINVGLLGASAHLVRMVGPYRARLLYLTGGTATAEEMFLAGSVAQVTSRDELDAAALAIAQTLAGKSPIALRLAKEALVRTEGMPLFDGYRIEQDYTNRLSTFRDAAEARSAWGEKREPRWGFE